jgi:hypothetical protein
MFLQELLLKRKDRLYKISEEKYSLFKKANKELMDYMEQCMKEYEQCSDVDDNLLNLFKAYKSSSGEFDDECEKNKESKNEIIQQICQLNKKSNQFKKIYLKASRKFTGKTSIEKIEKRRKKLEESSKKREEEIRALKEQMAKKDEERNKQGTNESDELYEIRRDNTLDCITFFHHVRYCIKRKQDRLAIYSHVDYEGATGKVVSMEDVLYFFIEEKTKTSSKSNLSLATTEMLWGTAAAVNSANNTYIDRKAIILFKYGSGIDPITISDKKAIEGLMKIMPEKLKLS